MEAEEAPQLVDRRFVIVDAEVDEDVREAGIATVALDDQERRRLLAAAVSAGGLRRGQAFQQALREWPVAPSKVSASASTVSPETRRFP